MNEIALLEASFADMMGAIEVTAEIPARTRSHWLCSLRQIAKAMDKPVDTIPARWTAVRRALARLHHARVGANPKTLANHKSNVRAAILWYGKEQGGPLRRMPLAADWESLRQRLPDQRSRFLLSALMRYCSALKIAPDAVDELVIDGYMRYRGETTALATGLGARRTIARTWNRCAALIEGWSLQQLVEPAVKPMEGPAWKDFPEGFRTDVEAYLNRLAGVRRSSTGKRLRPCRSATIRTRRAELVAAARTAARECIPITRLTSLQALLDPEVVELVIDAYWKRDGAEPSTYTVDLGSKFLSIARDIGCLGTEAMERLHEIRASLEVYRRGGMTEKNLTLIRQVFGLHPVPKTPS